MGRIDNPDIWAKVQANVQEAERLAEQKKYNLSMIKVRQTLEYIVRLQCDKAGIVEGAPDHMVRELYHGQWISKASAERFLKILAIGDEAASKGDNSAANASLSLELLLSELAPTVKDSHVSPRRETSDRPSAARTGAGARQTSSRQTSGRQTSARQSSGRQTSARQTSAARQPSSRQRQSSATARRASESSSRSRRKQGSGGLNPFDLLKLLIPVVLIVILIFLIRILSPDKTPTDETTQAPETTMATTAETTTEAPTAAPETTAAPVSYKTTDVLNVRQEPSTSAEILGKLARDTTVEYVRDEDETWAVIMYNGQEAYVSKQYLTSAAE